MIRTFSSFFLLFLSLGGQIHRWQHTVSILTLCTSCHQQFESSFLPEENFPFLWGLFTAVCSWNTLSCGLICDQHVFTLQSCIIIHSQHGEMQLLYAKDIIYIPKDVENEIFPSRSHLFSSESNSLLLFPFIGHEFPCLHLLECSMCIS